MGTDDASVTLQDENATLRSQVAALREQLAAALQRIADLEAKKTPPPTFVKAATPPREPKPRRKRAPEHNRARRREEPTQIVEHPIEHCPDCGLRLGGVHVGRVRQVVDLPPPPPVEIVEHRVFTGWCAECKRWREARLDLREQTLGQGRLGVGIASLVAHLRTGLRLPLRSIQRFLLDLHGLRLSVGEVVELLHRAAVVATPAVEGIRDTARRRAVVHADETGWREGGRNGYLWLLATPEGERSVEYHPSRAGAVANALVGEDFTGVLVTDFYGGYNDTPGGRHQRCWVHLLRDLRALRDGHAQTAGLVGWEVRCWVGALLDLWSRIRRAATSPPHLDARRAGWHTAMHAELLALAEQFVDVADHPCHTLARRLWRFQHDLLTCVQQPGVPPDNNAAERAIRPLVVVRKISGGTRSPRGSATALRLYSLAATWTAKGASPLAQFRALLSTPLAQV